MKRFFALAAVVVMMTASVAWAQEWVKCTGEYAGYCKWSANSCVDISSGPPPDGKATCELAYKNCEDYGGVYTDANCTQAVGTPIIACGYDCDWGTGGCWEIKTNPKGANDSPVTTTCEQAIAGCDKDGVRYPSNDNTCTGTPIGGSVPVGYCRWWPNPSSSDPDEKVGSCWPVTEENKAGCIADGSLYALDVPASGQGAGKQCEGGTWANAGRNPNTVVYCDYGALQSDGTGGCVVETDAATCRGNTGTPYSDANCTVPLSVKLLANKAATPGLKVSYAKNRVTVNWTPTAKISSGTVQLLNIKGAVLSTAFIKANSSKVTAKLGTVGVPAGMYFVHINAVGVNGQKIVSQSAVSVVK